MSDKDRDRYLADHLRAYLDRRSPPRFMKPAAVIMEARALLATVLRKAPARGYQEWWEAIEWRLSEANPTRVWPSEGDLAAADNRVRTAWQGNREDSRPPEALREKAILDLMEKHFRTTKSQLQGCGRPDRTKALIARGVLADLRKAHFYGFDLDEDDRRKAETMLPS